MEWEDTPADEGGRARTAARTEEGRDEARVATRTAAAWAGRARTAADEAGTRAWTGTPAAEADNSV